jgi:hypothetical protein
MASEHPSQQMTIGRLWKSAVVAALAIALGGRWWEIEAQTHPRERFPWYTVPLAILVLARPWWWWLKSPPGALGALLSIDQESRTAEGTRWQDAIFVWACVGLALFIWLACR